MLFMNGNSGGPRMPAQAGLQGKVPKVSMGRRLFLFFLALIAALLGVTLGILSFTGIIVYPQGSTRRIISGELAALAEDITRRLGETSVHALALSSSLSEGIERSLAGSGLSFSQLPGRAEALDPLMDSLAARLLSALDKTSCTGVFAALDATVNPALPNARYSRAGLYIRNVEPSGSSLIAMRTALRGSAGVIFRNRLDLQSLWELEFQTGDRLFYNEPIKGYLANPRLPLSRLYYWTNQSPIPGLNERVLVCAIPITGKDGELFGVCGFEISNANFRVANSPNASLYSLFPRAAALVAPLDDTGLNLENALVSGNLPIKSGRLKAGPLREGLFLYSGEGKPYAGLHESLRLYPADSPFAGERASANFAAALLVSKEELEGIILVRCLRIALAFAALFGAGALLALCLSRGFVKPIAKSLDALGQGKREESRLHEIDELLAKIAVPRTSGTLQGEAPEIRAGDLFGDFIARCKTLTPTERQIFGYHVRGLSMEEIFAAKAMSMSTFKAHHSHIYAKLGVSAIEELRLYIDLIKKSGLSQELDLVQ